MVPLGLTLLILQYSGSGLASSCVLDDFHACLLVQGSEVQPAKPASPQPMLCPGLETLGRRGWEVSCPCNQNSLPFIQGSVV